jgi:hypothetical protein
MSTVHPSRGSLATSQHALLAALRWYLRVASAFLFFVSLVDGLVQGFNFLSLLAFNGVFLAVALGAFVNSLSKQVNWIVNAVFVLTWIGLSLSYLEVLHPGPPLIIQILTALMTLGGLIIVPLASRQQPSPSAAS